MYQLPACKKLMRRGKRFAKQDAVIHVISNFFDHGGAGFFNRSTFALKIRWVHYIAPDGGYFAE